MPSEHPGVTRTALDAVTTLSASVTGRVLTPDDVDYAERHRIWNHDRQERPAAIVECTDADDVVAAVGFARARSLPLAVRAGGYAPAGSGTCADGLVLDMRSDRSVRIDAASRTVTVGPGVTWGELDRETQRIGLVVPSLPIAGIGVAGSTLSGGFGMLRRSYGLACDNLAGADVVLADGTRTSASGDNNPELLWGLRGGGGNFGVVTSLKFHLRPLPLPVLSGACAYPADRAADLLAFYRSWTDGLRQDVTSRFTLLGAPHSVPLTRALGGQPTALITVLCTGPAGDAARLVRPVRECGPVLADRIFIQPYVEMQARSTDIYPPGGCAVIASEYLSDLDAPVVAAVCAAFADMPTGSCEIRIDHMGGAVSRVAPMSTAVPNRDAPYVLTAMARWAGIGSDALGSDGTSERAWLAATQERLRPHGRGGPHVAMAAPGTPGVQAYGPERYLRLSALKLQLDPDNVFAHNLNVAPLG